MFSFCYNGIDFSHKRGTAATPLDDFGKHLHPFHELLFFVEGNVTYCVESESRKLIENDLVLIPQGRYHFADVDCCDNYERYVLKFPDNILPHYVSEKLASMESVYFSVKKYAFIFNQLDSFRENYNDEETYLLFVGELVKLLIMLLKEPNASSTDRNSVIARLIRYIDDNLQSNISLDTLSKEFSYSKSYISNEFKNVMKIPVMQYVRYKKIIAAHQMILAGEKKSVVADIFNFNDYSTFYRSYVKIIGHAPTDRK